MKPASAKTSRNLTGKYLRPLKKYRQSKTAHEYFYQRASIDISDPTKCWSFNSSVDKDGYHQVGSSVAYKELGVARAHQLSFRLHVGEIPSGMFVCHTCDNPGCVNPSHLFLGTPNDNVQDMINKGRYVPGKRTKKLTTDDIVNILRCKSKATAIELAAQYNVSWSLIYKIWRDYDTSVL